MIYSKNDISKFYSNVVKENLEYGDINIKSMSGSQGEDSRIDINLGGGRIRRILIDSNYDFCLGQVTFIKVIDFMDDGSTIYWNDKGDVVQSFYFIRIKGGSNYYVASIRDIDHIKTKVKTRDDLRYQITNWTKLDSKYYPIFKKVVQKFNQPGWKRGDIINVTTRVYDGKKYYMLKKYSGNTIILRREGYKFYLD